MTKAQFYITLYLSFVLTISTEAQLRVSNLAEYQLGNIPEVKPDDVSSLYNQLEMSYRQQGLSLYGKAELFAPSQFQERSYARLSQWRASYRTTQLSIELGHHYASLGRGLLLRSYSLPASLYEDRGNRIRYAYDKDFFGLSAKYKSKYVDIKLLSGKPLTVGLPPTLDWQERRSDHIDGAQLGLKLNKNTLNILAMRHQNQNLSDAYLGLNYARSWGNFNIFSEWVSRTDQQAYFKSSSSYAFYSGANYYAGIWGISAELKDYKNIAIGNGVNDPPSLAKEHNVRLLNRLTHVPFLNHERGYQVDLWLNFDNGHTLSANHALGENVIGANTAIFQEYYVDYKFVMNAMFSWLWYADYSTEPLRFEPARWTTGVQLDVEHGDWSSLINVDLQYIEREIITRSEFMNAYFSYVLAKAGVLSIAGVLEYSADPFVMDAEQEAQWYPSANLAIEIAPQHTLSLFAGKRRGGPSCTSGVCYDVLDFQGVELRLMSRF